jgi:fumarate hydratase class I
MQPDITEEVLELVRLAATDLPQDVECSLHRAREREEPGSAAQGALDAILKNIKLARQNSTPICQDTGTPIFLVDHPRGWSTQLLRSQITQALVEATRQAFLRPNSVHPVTGKNTGDNTGDEYYPSIRFREGEREGLTVHLMLKGGGCENVSRQVDLPDVRLGAWRDLEGVRKAALDAVCRAQGKGCAPGVLGIAVGGDRATSYAASKEALFRSLEDEHPRAELAALEEAITDQSNQLGIGPMGFSGKTTVLGTKIKAIHRLPACYFVSISYMCWAYRRRRLVYQNGEAHYS